MSNKDMKRSRLEIQDGDLGLSSFTVKQGRRTIVKGTVATYAVRGCARRQIGLYLAAQGRLSTKPEPVDPDLDPLAKMS